MHGKILISRFQIRYTTVDRNNEYFTSLIKFATIALGTDIKISVKQANRFTPYNILRSVIYSSDIEPHVYIGLSTILFQNCTESLVATYDSFYFSHLYSLNTLFLLKGTFMFFVNRWIYIIPFAPSTH